MKTTEAILKRLYYKPKGGAAFSGPQRLLTAARELGHDISRAEIKAWLRRQETYNLHHPARRHFPRQRTVVSGIHELWQGDLGVMRNISDANDGFEYILFCIDAFSKLGYAAPIKTKQPEDVIKGFESILNAENAPLYLMTDNGTEFVNKQLKSYLLKRGIYHYTGRNSSTKAAIAERFIRTIKSRLYKYFTANNTTRYLEVLPDIIEGYNHAYHRSIKMKPIDVTANHTKVIRERLFGAPPPAKTPFKFKVNDLVKVTVEKKQFEKGYVKTHSEEYFTIHSRYRRDNFNLYQLIDLSFEPIAGSFYELELLKVEKEGAIYKVEKILKSRGRGRTREHLVRWLGYPSKFDQWIPARDVKTL